MKPGGMIDKAVSRIEGTPLYAPVRTMRSLLGRLTEAREKWAERPLLPRLDLLAWRFLSWIARKNASEAEPALRELEIAMAKKLKDPNISEEEPRTVRFSVVMGSLKHWATTTRPGFDWSTPHVGGGGGSSLLLSLRAAGVAESLLDERTSQRALSRSRPRQGERPEVRFHLRSLWDGTLDHQLAHELFHIAAPLGGGLCLDSHAREIMAHRFAVEMSNPMPGLIRSAETDAAAVFDRPFAFEEVMRASSRPMFSVTIPAAGDVETGSIVVQARESLAPWWDPGLNQFTPSWDDLVLWSKPGSVDYYPPNVSWNPVLSSSGPRGFVNLQATEGLYYILETTDEVWSALSQTGIVDVDEFAGLSPGMARFAPRDIPEVTTDGGVVVIEGGRYLVIYVLKDLITYPDHLPRTVQQLLAVKDSDGYLCQAWEQAAGGRKPRWGPILPPLDTQRHEHLVPYDNWWRADVTWREVTFDYWAEMMTNKFVRDLAADEEIKRQTWERDILSEMRNGRHQPGFEAR